MPQTNEQRERAAIERLRAEARTNPNLSWLPAEDDPSVIGFSAFFRYGISGGVHYNEFRVSCDRWDDEAVCEYQSAAMGPTPFIAVFRLIARIEQFATPIEEPEDEG